jgi:tetratricopeptide (TPR) repeat protein
VVLALAAVGVLYSLTPVHNANFFWHLRNGLDILDSGEVRTTDPFTHTMCGREWLQQEWGAEVAMALSWRLGGEAGPVLLKALLVAAAVVLAGMEARRRGADWRAIAFVGVLWLGLGHPRWIARPHVTTIFFFSLYLFAIPRLRERGWLTSLAVFVPLQVLWANSHAGFVMGPFLLALPLLDDATAGRWARAVRWSPLPVVTLAASVVHPNGLGSLRYLTGFFSQPLFRQSIREWWSPFDPRYQPALPISRTAVYIVILTLLAAALIRARRKRVRPSVIAGLAILTLASAVASRNIELLSMAGLAWLAPLASGKVSRWLAGGLLAGAAAVPLLFGVPREVGPPRELGLSVDWSIYPRRTADFLQRHPGLLDGTLYNTHEVAGYLEYRFGRRLPLYMDGRCLLYPESFYSEYLAMTSPASRSRALPVQAGVLISRDIDLAVVHWPSSKGSVAYLLADLPFWKPVFWDGVAVTYARTDLLARGGLDHLAFDEVDPLRSGDLLEKPAYLQPVSLEGELRRASAMGLDRASILLALLRLAEGDREESVRLAAALGDPGLAGMMSRALHPEGELPESADPAVATAFCWSRARAGMADGALEAASRSGDPVLVNAAAALAGDTVRAEPGLPWVLKAGMRALARPSDSTGAAALSARASALWCCGLRDSAMVTLDAVLQEDSLAAWQLASASALRAMHGERQSSLAAARRAVGARPTPFSLYATGLALREAGRPREAAGALGEAVRLSPNYAPAVLGLADVLWGLGRMAEAAELYAAAAGETELPAEASRRLRLAETLGPSFLDSMAEGIKDSGT